MEGVITEASQSWGVEPEQMVLATVGSAFDVQKPKDLLELASVRGCAWPGKAPNLKEAMLFSLAALIREAEDK